VLLNQIMRYQVARIRFAWVAVALIAVAGALTSSAASRAAAIAAGSQTITETGHLHKTSKNGASFVEQGSASGTYRGTMTVDLTTTSRGVKFRITGYLPGGTVSGYGSANLDSEGKVAQFSGTAVDSGGSGRYRHAHGSGFKIKGSLNRESYALAITFGGNFFS
jgi:hypothetical protein